MKKCWQISEKTRWTPNSTRFIPLNYTQLSRNLFRKLPRLLSKLLRMGHRYILLKWDHFKTIFPDLFLMSLEKESQWWQYSLPAGVWIPIPNRTVSAKLNCDFSFLFLDFLWIQKTWTEMPKTLTFFFLVWTVIDFFFQSDLVSWFIPSYSNFNA